MKALSLFQKSLKGDECALIFSQVSRFFLSGFSSSDGVLLITPRESRLYLDSRYFEMALLKQKTGRISEKIRLFSTPFGRDFLLFSENGKYPKVLIEDTRLTVAELASLEERFPKSKFVPMGRILEEMRIVKTEKEIDHIRVAQRLAEEAYEYILPRLEVGRSENSVAAELEYYMKLHGAEKPSFPTICVSGTRTSLPHGTPTAAPLEKNCFITMDFGCVLDGYSSDMTRTVCLGKANEKMRLVYNTVLEAQLAGLAAVSAGVKGKEVDLAARSVIERAGFGKFFGHSTGHGIGLQVHEAPSFAPRTESVIPAGAVLSVEPGIYLPGEFGVRIEDLIVVREGGGENLNTVSKELLEL
jgi:Xaa-Pro aminopeptidase